VKQSVTRNTQLMTQQVTCLSTVCPSVFRLSPTLPYLAPPLLPLSTCCSVGSSLKTDRLPSADSRVTTPVSWQRRRLSRPYVGKLLKARLQRTQYCICVDKQSIPSFINHTEPNNVGSGDELQRPVSAKIISKRASRFYRHWHFNFFICYLARGNAGG